MEPDGPHTTSPTSRRRTESASVRTYRRIKEPGSNDGRVSSGTARNAEVLATVVAGERAQDLRRAICSSSSISSAQKWTVSKPGPCQTPRVVCPTAMLREHSASQTARP
jgi:hypothetical protein